MKNEESTYLKDLEKLYFNTEGRFADMYVSDPVHFLNKQLEKQLGRKATQSEINELEIEKLSGDALIYDVKYVGSLIGTFSISRDSHSYELRLHFKRI